MDLRMAHKPYCYCVSAYGTTTGQSGRFMKERLAERGIPLSAAFCVKTVDTWTPMYDLSDPVKNLRQTMAAEEQARDVAKQTASRSTGDFMKRKVPMTLVRWFYPRFVLRGRIPGHGAYQ